MLGGDRMVAAFLRNKRPHRQPGRSQGKSAGASGNRKEKLNPEIPEVFNTRLESFFDILQQLLAYRRIQSAALQLS